MRIVPKLQVIRNDLVIFPMQEFFYGKISRLHKFVSLGIKRFCLSCNAGNVFWVARCARLLAQLSFARIRFECPSPPPPPPTTPPTNFNLISLYNILVYLLPFMIVSQFSTF